MRLVLSLAATLFLTTLQPLAAQAPSSAARDARKTPASSASSEADQARARNEAKEKAWDEKMKRTMRSICSGVTGC